MTRVCRCSVMVFLLVLMGAGGLMAPSHYSKMLAAQATEKNSLLQSVETLVRGLAARETKIGGVAGEVVIRHSYSPSHWEMVVGHRKTWRTALEEGQAGDRDSGIARFHLGQRKYWYEIQMGLWAGGNNWFPLDFSRSAEDVSDLYLRVFGDGEFIFEYDRSTPRYATGTLVREASSTPACLRGPFANGLGLAYGCMSLSEFLRFLFESNGRVHACEQEATEVGDCYKMTLVVDADYTCGQYELWIAPSLGYAPVRMNHFFVDKERPQKGRQTVYEWKDFRPVGNDVLLPHLYTIAQYRYRSAEQAEGAWESSKGHEYVHLAIVDEPVLKMSDWGFPVGTWIRCYNPILGQRLSPEECRQARGHLVEASAYTLPVSRHKVPRPDPEFNKPLSGDELTHLQERYDSAVSP